MTTFISDKIPSVIPHINFPLIVNEDVTSMAEFLIGAWAILALDHLEVARQMQEFLATDKAKKGTPLMFLWGRKEQKKWLADSRNALFASFDLVKFRLLCMRLFAGNVTDPTVIARAMAREGFHGDEGALYQKLVKSRFVRSKFLAYLKPLERPEIASELTFNTRILREQLEEDLGKYRLVAASKAKVRAKLEFIYKHNNLSADDLAQDVLARGISYYFRARPTLSRLHAANSAKSAMDGACSAHLRYWTNPDRSRLTETALGWSSTIMSIDDAPQALLDSNNNSPYGV